MSFDKRYSMFIGRFQPFHDGHKWLLEQRLKLGKKVCVAVMDIHETEPEKNPYTYYEVMMKIEKEMTDYMNNGLLKIISIPPIESVNYGREVGYDVIEHIPPKEIEKISATNIRKKNEL